MEIEIRKLTPELVDDYVKFFDITPHSTGIEEHRCYCVCWASTKGNLEECATAAQRREVAKRYIKNHFLQGYLAYHENKVVGWCNANTKFECYECISWQMSMNDIRKDDKRVKSVFCFAIAPEYQRKGIGSRMLEKVCEDAKNDGFEYVEAYPNAEFIDTEQDFMGPVSMYEKLGFTLSYETSTKKVMVKTL